MGKNSGRRKGRASPTPPGPQNAAWTHSTWERLALTEAGRQETLESPLPQSKKKPRGEPIAPPRGNLSEEALATYRGIGQPGRSQNATFTTGFEPQRHAMIVEGRPVVVILVNQTTVVYVHLNFKSSPPEKSKSPKSVL